MKDNISYARKTNSKHTLNNLKYQISITGYEKIVSAKTWFTYILQLLSDITHMENLLEMYLRELSKTNLFHLTVIAIQMCDNNISMLHWHV